jgi:bifunctional polynucleotide phosphatase/kinase
MWTHNESYVVGVLNTDEHRDTTNESNLIASFDLDHTIITTKTGHTFAKDKHDWKFWHDCVVTKMIELHELCYKIVIFTNQKGLKTQDKIADFCDKVEDIATQLPVPFEIYISVKHNMYRKPVTGLWDKYIGDSFDKEHSFYCGDAAGRKTPKDFNDTDYKFALNLKIPFKTPEMLFLNEIEKLPNPCLKYVKLEKTCDRREVRPTTGELDDLEMIIMVGSPASGKSTYVNTYLKQYKRVNQDTLKTKAKCLKTAEAYLKSGESVVIDNTNPSVEARKVYIDLASKYNATIRCVRFDHSMKLAEHNSGYRNFKTNNKTDVIPVIVFRVFNKNYVEPTHAEGFDSIDVVPTNNCSDDPLYYKFYS